MASRKVMLIFIASIIISQVIQLTSSARIAVLLFFCSKSMKNAFDPLLIELANRGHQLTVVSPIPSVYNNSNIRMINGPNFKDFITSFENFFEVRSRREVIFPTRLFPFTEQICRAHYELPEVEALRHEEFDLVITNGLLNECVFGLIHHFQAPYIGLCTIASPPWLSRALGAPAPPSFVPIYFLPYTDRMTFFERVFNFYRAVQIDLDRRYYYNPKIESIYKDYYPNAADIEEMQSNYSLVLMNSHPTLNFPRPNLPEMIEIGGLHCKEAKPLPKDLEDFVQSSGEYGFIVFSMGSIVPGTDMPERFRLAFLNTFSKLKQKVIWKWESEQMPDIPPNVKLVKWIPQQDLLGHPKIRLFITHGGLLSTEESVYHGVPLIGIPMFADQDLNMRQADMHGYGLKLELSDITEEVLTEKVYAILNYKRFKEKATYLSKIFRDKLGSPLEKAVFWTEYVLRHKGAPHLRSAARHLNFFQYHSLDVIAFLLVTLAIISYICYYIVRYIIIAGILYLFGFSKNRSLSNNKKTQ